MSNKLPAEFTTSHNFRGALPSAEDLVSIDLIGEGRPVRIVSTRRTPMTVAMASKILSLTPVPGDRGLRDNGVTTHMANMQNGTFLYENHVIASCFCLENRLDYRINGQHTSWSVYYLDRQGIKIDHRPSTVIAYEADTLAAVRTLYGLYDRNLARERGQVVACNLVDTDGFVGLRADTLKRVVAGFSLWQWPETTRRHQQDPTSVVGLMRRDHGALCERVCKFIHESGSFDAKEMGFLRRSAVIAAMFETFMAMPRKSIDFWTTVRDGLNLSVMTDPRYRLRINLQTYTVGSANTKSASKTTDVETMYRWCISAWNRWCKGDTDVKELRGGASRTEASRRFNGVADD